MLSLLLLSLVAVLPMLFSCAKGYDLVKDYSGMAFFDGWDFYGGYDNLTYGDVVWLDIDQAYGQGLVYINGAGNAILKVDNEHSVPFNQKRGSVRIATKVSYAVRSLWIADMVHIPYGCSVWPAFWTTGPTWPNNGEIDIMEGMNLVDHNQMTLHTLPGCEHSTPPNQMGVSGELDCSTPTGCFVAETKPNSYQAGFAAAGGGVFATQFDVAGIFIWFWSRPDIPMSVTKAASSLTLPIDMSDWGPPSASFPATSCNIAQFFSPQKLILDITLCGSWAGLPEFYSSTCGNSGPTGICYNDNVVGPGDRFDNAYFEIQYVRAYTTSAPTPTTAVVTVASAKTTAQTSIGTQLAPSSLSYPGGAAGLHVERGAGISLLLVMVGAVVGCLLGL